MIPYQLADAFHIKQVSTIVITLNASDKDMYSQLV